MIISLVPSYDTTRCNCGRQVKQFMHKVNPSAKYQDIGLERIGLATKIYVVQVRAIPLPATRRWFVMTMTMTMTMTVAVRIPPQTISLISLSSLLPFQMPFQMPESRPG